MMYPKKTFVRISAIVLALTATPQLLITVLDPKAARAQSPTPTSFPLPNELPSGSTLEVDGSSSMEIINEALKARFEERFSDATVDLNTNGTPEALQALLDGEINLAAVGRGLTDEEKAQGLTEVPVSREKVAIIVGPDNSFQGDITFEQFAQIFRGEITDWSELGGEPGPIRLVDRPDTSDTRQALSQYDVFQTAPFETGSNTTQVAEDDTAAVINELGNDGIGYAIADQVLELNTVRIVPMHQTLPDDPRYPFSQPRGYVYREADPVAQAFLGFATSAPGQEAVAEAKAEEAEVVESEVAATTETAPAPAEPDTALVPGAADSAVATQDRGGLGWLWLLPLLLAGGLLWWLFGRRPAAPIAGAGAATGAAGAVLPPPLPVEPSRIILTPRDCKNAYAYWEVPERTKADLREQGGRKLALRLYDVTDVDMERQTPHSVKQFDCKESDPDLHVPIAVDDRDYIAELGYVTDNDRWLSIARSEHVRVPACAPAGNLPKVGGAALAGAAALAGGAAVAAATRPTEIKPPAPVVVPPVAPAIEESRIVLTPRHSKAAYAYWEAPHSAKEALRQQGGRDLRLRIYDATDIDLDKQPAHHTDEYDIIAIDTDKHVPIPTPDRDYVAEIGYVTDDGGWLKLARSQPVRVPADAPSISTPSSTASSPTGISGAVTGGVVAAGAAATGIAATVLGDKISDRIADTQPTPASRITLATRSPETAYASWSIPEAHRANLKRQGGQKPKLRLYDVTGIDLDHQPAHSIQEYDCGELDTNRLVPIPLADRNYIAEVGYVTDDGRWLKLARSAHVRIPPAPALLPNPETVVMPPVASIDRCSIKNLVVHNRRNCYLLDTERMRQLQEQTSVSKTLEPGSYIIRIKEGTFGYGTLAGQVDEPLVVLWLNGGKLINRKTDVAVPATWSTLNGYDDTLTLEVLETTTLHALFFDTYLNDNQGEVTVSVVKLPAL